MGEPGAGQRYDLVEPIAAGGMGEVFRGRVLGEHGFHKTVAIKRIRPELARHDEFRVRFVAEAKMAVSLSHANVVQVFDLGRAGDELLLVMEYVQGADLGQLLSKVALRGERMPVAIAVHVAMEALKGLVYAHERVVDGKPAGVIHCDLSPSNLLVSYAGEVKIGDFGVAEAIELARKRQPGDKVMGKVRYLSPEQLEGRPLDGRTDLYSLGVVLWEMLTGQRAFAANESDSITRRVLEGDERPVMVLRPEVPLALDELLRHAMSVRPGDRPSSARVMLAELTKIARLCDAVTAPEVGSWAREVMPPKDLDTSGSFDRALQNLVGVRRGTATLSADRGLKSTMTFVVKKTVDGVTLLDRVVTAPVRSRAALYTVGGVLLALAASAVGLTVRSGRRTASASEPASMPVPSAAAPSLPVPLPSSAPSPAAVPSVVPAPAPSPREMVAAVTSRPPTMKAHERARVALKPSAESGYVNLYAEPWAVVFVDGKKIGTTPMAHVALPAGSHRFRFENPAMKPNERAVVVEAGQTQLVDVDLEPR